MKLLKNYFNKSYSYEICLSSSEFMEKYATENFILRKINKEGKNTFSFFYDSESKVRCNSMLVIQLPVS